MSGSSKYDYLMGASLLLLAVALFAGLSLYREDAASLFRTVFSTPPPTSSGQRTAAPDLAPPSAPAPERSRTADAARQTPAPGAFPVAAPRPPAVNSSPPKDDQKKASGEERNSDAPAGRQKLSERETSEQPDRIPGGATAERQKTSEREMPAAEAAPGADDSGRKTEGAAAPDLASNPPAPLPLIVYGKGSAAGSAGNVVLGTIPERQLPPDTTELFGAAGDRSADEKSRRVSPKGEDSVIGMDFIRELAQFLADNYWPAGTHPRARRRGISTASVKWADVRFGAYLRGFAVNQRDIPRERARVLRYFFMPSMVKGLYELYSERFVDALAQEALSQKRGPDKRALSKSEIAEMYEVYGAMARGLAETVRAYADTPGARPLAKAYLDAAGHAEQVNQRLLAAIQTDAAEKHALTAQYRAAILQREERRESLIVTLRKRGTARRLDNDAMLYTALWLYRRGENSSNAAAKALADVLDRCADRLDAEKQKTRGGRSSQGQNTE
jgi:hypothetical protein